VLPRRQANKSQPVALRHFSHWPRRIGSVGKGGPQGVSGARRGLKMKSEGKREKGREGVVGKAARDECVFIPGEGPGLADEIGSNAMPDAAGGEGGHRPAKPNGVIHRYGYYRGRKVMSSHTGLVLLREPRLLYQARDQVVREPTGSRREQGGGKDGVVVCG
jgi:hypothetical protein